MRERIASQQLLVDLSMFMIDDDNEPDRILENTILQTSIQTDILAATAPTMHRHRKYVGAAIFEREFSGIAFSGIALRS